jgi:hypothetical protein
MLMHGKRDGRRLLQANTMALAEKWRPCKSAEEVLNTYFQFNILELKHIYSHESTVNF